MYIVSDPNDQPWIMVILPRKSVITVISASCGITVKVSCKSSYFLIQYVKLLNYRYLINITILFYQLGMCSVAILFISDNMVGFCLFVYLYFLFFIVYTSIIPSCCF